MSKKIIKLAVLLPALLGTLVVSSVFVFNVVRHAIIEDNEALVHSVAQSILPSLLVNDTQQVEALMKALEAYPGIQSAELVSSVGAPIASYAKAGQALDPLAPAFELASAADDPNQLYVMAPITFDSVIVANLHIAVNLWPTYLRIMTWLGLLLIVPSALYVAIKQLRLKLRFEVIKNGGGPGAGGRSFDVNQAVNKAMTDADISLEYQPIQRMSDGGLFGMEVLVCWRHPSGQTLHISPSNFVELARKNDICLPFDQWLLTSACTSAAAWQHQYGPLVMSININASQFLDRDFPSKVREVCARAQYPHQLLEIEVNECILSQNTAQVQARVEAFSAQGLSLTVDQFGLTSASLELFEISPIRKVKFDGKLVKRIEWDAQISDWMQQAVSKAILSDVQVMSEGVESAIQYDALQRMGCALGQGSHFSQPMTTKAFEAFLAERPFHVSQFRAAQLGVQPKSKADKGYVTI